MADFKTKVTDFATNAAGNIGNALGDATGLSGPLKRLGGILKPGGEDGATPPQPSAKVKKDKRLKIKIGPSYLGGPSKILASKLDNAVLFPYTPQIIVQTRANYNSVQPTHSNYAFQAYSNSQLDSITIVGTFTAQNAGEAEIVLGTIHALRTVTKMHFGGGANVGAPPPVCLLSGFGDFMFNDMPVVISSFFFTLNEDVDYINVQGGNGSSYPGSTACPTRCEITVECLPAFSRLDQASFTMESYIDGTMNKRGLI